MNIQNEVKNNNSYIARAGESFVAGEFLIRGFSVSVPIHDIGYDMVVESKSGKFLRIQVKNSGNSHMRGNYKTPFYRWSLKRGDGGGKLDAGQFCDYYALVAWHPKMVLIVPSKDLKDKSTFGMSLGKIENSKYLFDYDALNR